MRTPSLLTYSKRLAASYVVDWLFIFIIAALGGGFSLLAPFHRPFSLLDLNISFPYVNESVPVKYVILICGFAPAGVIALVVILFVPGPAFCRSSNRSQIFRMKLWELEKGAAGFCLALSLSFFVTQGMKNIFGKPRPNMLARCVPDLDNISSHAVGGYGQDISARWMLVDIGICTTNDMKGLNDGFRSFPSGHSSFSWAAMLYLTLFFCSKFAIAIPFLPQQSTARVAGLTASDEHELLPLHNNGRDFGEGSNEEIAHKNPGSRASTTLTSNELPLRNRAAAPPIHLLIFALLPLAVAMWIVSTRFKEFYHFGFDLIFGSLIGMLSAWFAFRWYHLPIMNGQGWAWGARSRDRAFGVGVGTGGFVGDEGWLSNRKRTDDGESGRAR